MRTLKKLFIAAIMISAIGLLKAQDNSKIQNAFSKSYSYEYKKEYKKAYDVMKLIYDENSYEINLRSGWVAYLAGQYTESMNFYQKAIDLKPTSIEARLGIVYPINELKDKEKLKAKYEEILKIDPLNSVANYRLGCIYYGKGDYDKATEYLNVAISLYPFDYYITYMLAWTKYKQGKNAEAKDLFNRLLMILPNDQYAIEALSKIK